MEDKKRIKKIKKKNKKRPHSLVSETTNKSDNNEKEDFLDPSEEWNDERDKNVNISMSTQNLPDSDSDEPKKKKKKKKKTEGIVSESNSKNKSIRQAKREKFAQRQAESQATAKQQIKSECLNYLSQWKHNRQNWKFMKAKQVWLYKNKFSESLVPKESWPLLLEYFESAKGNIRKMLLDDASKVIKQMDDWTESHNNQDNNEEEDDDGEDSESKKPSEAIYKRARELIQFLEE